MAVEEKFGKPALVDHYLTAISPIPGSGNRLESAATSDHVDLSESAINMRIETADAELRRIIKDYLGDRPILHQIAHRLMAGGKSALCMLRDRDEEAIRTNDDAQASLETIVRVDGSRPSFLIRHGKVDRSSSPIGAWGDTLEAGGDALGDAISCVGRIDDPRAEQGFQGTGFLVGENLILTNRHVLQTIAARNARGEWQFNAGVRIDFGHEFRADESIKPRLLRAVVFCVATPIQLNGAVDHARLDLVLIELERATGATRPRTTLALDTARDWAQPARSVFIVGYPANPGFAAFSPTLLEQLFKSTFGFKRLAPGLVTKPRAQVAPWTFAHDATTLGGNSGSVVLVCARERLAAGLHYGGSPTDLRENWGHVLGLTLERNDAQTGKSLGAILKDRGVRLLDSLAVNR